MAGANLLGSLSGMDPKCLFSGQLADTADHQLYTPPAGGSAIIRSASVCNVGAAACTFTLSLVPSGGTSDGTHSLISGDVSLAPNESWPLTDYLVGAHLGPGDAIHAQAGVAASLDFVITGLEVS